MHDVEDILDFWENSGLLRNVPDPLNLALLLHTQCRINKTISGYHTFKRCSIPALIYAARSKPELFTGLMDTEECVDVYRLGAVPHGSDEEICNDISQRLMAISITGILYFGGMVAKDGRLYLLTEQGDQ